MKIDYERLSAIAIDGAARNRKANDTSEVLAFYLQLISNLIYANEKLSESEMAMIISSINRWVTKKDILSSSTYGIGKIVQIDWGVNYSPELSYKHPAVIMEEWKNTVLVIPTTSTESKVLAAYHPVDNPTGKWYYRKVGVQEGFQHDSALILNNAKIMSKSRVTSISGSLTGNLSDEHNVFREVRNTMMKNFFQKEYISFENVKKKYSILCDEHEELKKKYEKAIAENKVLSERNTKLEADIKRAENI